jgi:UDP-galactopyranose mutase
MYDYLVVGCGLYGSVFARNVAEKGKKVLIIDKRKHIGGNCYTENIEGINVHKYGPHIFHTSNDKVWSFINKFSRFNQYEHRTKVNYKGNIYSFPINLMTLYQIWGVKTPKEAVKKLKQVKKRKKDHSSLESWIVSEVGEDLYRTFIYGYTSKQWGKDPKELPSSIIRRIPIRITYDDRYFNDKYQGIPENGYTRIFENMLDHKNIKIETNINFFENKKQLNNCSKQLVYTGKIDEFYDYKFGELEYRSLEFKTKVLNGDFQGCSIVNHTEKEVPFTRIVEHKHFERKNTQKTVVTWEYPKKYAKDRTPYYPIRDEKNSKLYKRYTSMNKEKVIFGGRLATYQYYDMHQVIAQAIKDSNNQT